MAVALLAQVVGEAARRADDHVLALAERVDVEARVRAPDAAVAAPAVRERAGAPSGVRGLQQTPHPVHRRGVWAHDAARRERAAAQPAGIGCAKALAGDREDKGRDGVGRFPRQ